MVTKYHLQWGNLIKKEMSSDDADTNLLEYWCKLVSPKLSFVRYDIPLKVSVKGVVALGCCFATLCQEVNFYEAKQFFFFFKKKRQILLHF